MYFEKQLRIVQELPELIEKSIRRTIHDYDNVLLEYIKTDQLRKKGEDGSGQKLGSYGLGYARIRVARGLQIAHIDLRFTGKFFASLKITAMPKAYKVSSNVAYDTKIVERFGKDVLKISHENLVEFANNILLRNLKRDLNDEFTRTRS
jgi:hypothetical protein